MPWQICHLLQPYPHTFSLTMQQFAFPSTPPLSLAIDSPINFDVAMVHLASHQIKIFSLIRGWQWWWWWWGHCRRDASVTNAQTDNQRKLAAKHNTTHSSHDDIFDAKMARAYATLTKKEWENGRCACSCLWYISASPTNLCLSHHFLEKENNVKLPPAVAASIKNDAEMPSMEVLIASKQRNGRTPIELMANEKSKKRNASSKTGIHIHPGVCCFVTV